jgi:Tfp pilus assembly protein PilF
MGSRWVAPLAAVIVGGFAMIAVAADGAPAADDVLKPQSVQFVQAGAAALAKGDAMAAIDSYEAALAADPKNVQAYTGLASAYDHLGLQGKAIKYYREALALNPSDVNALEAQGKALIARGATARAQVNLARIKALCKTDCTAATRLQTALNTATASADPAKPVTAAKN